MRGRRSLTDAPEALDDVARKRIKEWVGCRQPGLVPKLGKLWAECRDWHLANGVQRASWEATFRMWIRNQRRIERGEKIGAARSSAEPPSASGPGREIESYDRLIEDLTPVRSLLGKRREKRSRGSTTDRKTEE
jgi:hypothetical protein